MVQRRRPEQRHIGVGGTPYGVYQVHHLQGVLEGARGFLGQLLQERIAGVRHLNKARAGHQVEDFLEQVNERIQGHRGHGPHKDERQIYPPSGRAAHIDEAEAQVYQDFHPKENSRVQELPPALAEEAKGFHRYRAGRKEHHKEFHTVAAEDKERQQQHNVQREYLLFAEERQHIKGEHRERHHVHERRRQTHHQERHDGRQEENTEQEKVTGGPVKDKPCREMNHQIQDDNQREREQDIPKIQEDTRACIAVHMVVLLLIAVQDLGDFRRDDLPFGDNFFVGLHIAQGGRYIVV